MVFTVYLDRHALEASAHGRRNGGGRPGIILDDDHSGTVIVIEVLDIRNRLMQGIPVAAE